jgi:hypothetical protein
MGGQRIQTFAEFWPFYVGEHRKPLTRTLHFIGTTGVILCLVAAAITGRGLYAAVIPLCGYGFAWTAHFFVEKNRPATFSYPLWSLAADFVMYKKMWTGEMSGDVERILGATS